MKKSMRNVSCLLVLINIITTFTLLSCNLDETINSSSGGENNSNASSILQRQNVELLTESNKNMNITSLFSNPLSANAHLYSSRTNLGDKVWGLCPEEISPITFAKINSEYYYDYYKPFYVDFQGLSPYSFLYTKDFELSITANGSEEREFHTYNNDDYNAFVEIIADPNSDGSVSNYFEKYTMNIYAYKKDVGHLYKLEYFIDARSQSFKRGTNRVKLMEAGFEGSLSTYLATIDTSEFKLPTQLMLGAYIFSLKNIRLEPPSTTRIQQNDIASGYNMTRFTRDRVYAPISHLYSNYDEVEDSNYVAASGIIDFNIEKSDTNYEKVLTKNNNLNGYVVYDKTTLQVEKKPGDRELHSLYFLRRIEQSDIVEIYPMYVDDQNHYYSILYAYEPKNTYYKLNTGEIFTNTSHRTYTPLSTIFDQFIADELEYQTVTVSNIKSKFGNLTIYKVPTDYNFPRGTTLPQITISDKETLVNYIDEKIQLYGPNVNLNNIDTSQITDMSSLFSSSDGYGTNFNGDITCWDTSNVTNMSKMFKGATQFDLILDWDVSSVQDMSEMFMGASSFNSRLPFNVQYTDSTNGDPGRADLNQVTTMSRMFKDAVNFDQNIAWYTSNLTDVSEMFSGATNFDGSIRIDGRNITTLREMFKDAVSYDGYTNLGLRNAVDFTGMFENAISFNQNVSEWIVYENTTRMFKNATSFNNQIFTLHSISYASEMFQGARSFNQPLPPLRKGSGFRDTSRMFKDATSFNQNILWGDERTEDLRNVSEMFMGATSFNSSVELGPNITNMAGMFEGATSFIGVTFQYLNTSNVTDMSRMFKDTNLLISLSYIDTSSVTDMSEMFRGSTFNQSLDSFDTSNVTNMSGMFWGSTFNQSLDSFDTSNVTNMSGMFWGAENFNQSLASFDTGNVTDMTNMFYEAKDFIYSVACWDTSSVTDKNNMFTNSFFEKALGPKPGGDCSTLYPATSRVIAGRNDDSRYNELTFFSAHNSYASASMGNYLSNDFYSLEFDTSGITDGDETGGPNSSYVPGWGGGPYYKVSHSGEVELNYCGDAVSNSGKSTLRDCFGQVTSWISNNNPKVPITVFIDLKSGWSSEKLKLLDEFLTNRYSNKLYKFSDLVRDLGGSGPPFNVREELKTKGWPKAIDMRGKILIVYTGNSSIFNHYLKDYLDRNTFPTGFLCTSPSTSDQISSRQDGFTEDTSKYLVCSNYNYNKGDNLQLLLQKSAEYKQISRVYYVPNSSFYPKYRLNTLGAQHLAFDTHSPDLTTSYNPHPQQLPNISQRQGAPSKFALMTQSGLCFKAINDSVVFDDVCNDINDTNYHFEQYSTGHIKSRGNPNKVLTFFKGNNDFLVLYDTSSMSADEIVVDSWNFLANGAIANSKNSNDLLGATNLKLPAVPLLRSQQGFSDIASTRYILVPIDD